MWHTVSVEPLGNYHLHVVFEDGVEGCIDLSERLFGPVFEPLQDPHLFSQVFVDEFGVICWPNGADLAPDAVYEMLAGAIL